MNPQTSRKWSINWHDFEHALIHMGIVGSLAIISDLLTNILPNIHVTGIEATALTLGTGLLSLLRSWLVSYSK